MKKIQKTQSIIFKNAIFILFILAMPQIFAVEIHQILYDPATTETGGEAIELYNPADYDISLDGWTIGTSVSDQDVTFPKNATISAKSYFLVADVGWKTAKDNAEWRDADYEETMTLPNSDSGIVLKNKNGTIIDSVGWGDAAKIKNGLYAGSPAKQTKEGYALVRVSNTGNNLEDFREQSPVFNDGQSIVVSVDVSSSVQKINNVHILEDDINDSGIQIKPIAGRTRNITLSVSVEGSNPYVDFEGKIIALVRTNSSVLQLYSAAIPLDYYLPAGNHTIKVFAGAASAESTFEYLQLKKFEVTPSIVRFQTTQGERANAVDPIMLKNLGNTPVSISFTFADLKNQNNTLSAQNLLASIDSSAVKKIRETTINLLPGVQKEVRLSLDVPVATDVGKYTSLLKVFGD